MYKLLKVDLVARQLQLLLFYCRRDHHHHHVLCPLYSDTQPAPDSLPQSCPSKDESSSSSRISRITHGQRTESSHRVLQSPTPSETFEPLLLAQGDAEKPASKLDLFSVPEAHLQRCQTNPPSSGVSPIFLEERETNKLGCCSLSLRRPSDDLLIPIVNFDVRPPQIAEATMSVLTTDVEHPQLSNRDQSSERILSSHTSSQDINHTNDAPPYEGDEVASASRPDSFSLPLALSSIPAVPRLDTVDGEASSAPQAPGPIRPDVQTSSKQLHNRQTDKNKNTTNKDFEDAKAGSWVEPSIFSRPSPTKACSLRDKSIFHSQAASKVHHRMPEVEVKMPLAGTVTVCIDFPSVYPSRDYTPIFRVIESSPRLPEPVEKALVQALHATAMEHMPSLRGYLEPCIRRAIAFLYDPQISSSSTTGVSKCVYLHGSGLSPRW
ncbi:unnamed protein product [Protopolystoma xenopodis]|uniref:RWD domain-containing protein n=1 Tax=Protopolystoma xenopodis TaxID=117903 RepID=A0A3S5BSH9_9PLAT|nr:unnamed protein product [Protopolystoma xenopodis]